MPVYMARAGDYGPVKIGHSVDVPRRFAEIQSANHERLTVLRVFEGGQPEEAALHQRFADSWLHGEWHAFTKAMLGDVGLVEITPATAAPDAVEQDGEFVAIFADLSCRWRSWADRPIAELAEQLRLNAMRGAA